jgi:uncharacterized protein YdcH (DUF465 family)
MRKALAKIKNPVLYKRSLKFKSDSQVVKFSSDIKKLNDQIKYLENANINSKANTLKNLRDKTKIKLKADLIRKIIKYHGLGKTKESEEINVLLSKILKKEDAVMLKRINSDLSTILKKLNSAKIFDLENNLHNIVMILEDLNR